GHPDPGAVVPGDGADPALSVLAGTGPAVLVEEAEADADQPAGGAVRDLLPAQPGVAGAPLEAVQEPQVVAGIEVAAGGSPVREAGDHVPAPELEGVDPELGGGQVQHPLGGVGGGVHPHAAVGAGGALVAGDAERLE